MWNLKNKQTRQSENRFIDTESKWVFTRRKRCEGVGEIGEGIEEYKPPVI